MKVLLDECCPAPLKRVLKEFEVFTVEEAGFKGLSNGDLISAAEGRFNTLITADKNLRYQQNLAGRQLAIIELPFNSWPRVKLMAGIIVAALQRVAPGDYIVLPPQPEILP